MRVLFLTSLACLIPVAASADEISPLDGAWTTQMTDVTFNDACPAETKADLLPQFEQSLEQSSTRNVEFGGRFDPNLLEDGNRPYGWTQKDDNIWEGAMLSDGDKKIGTATFTVESDVLITVYSEIKLALMMNPANDPNFIHLFPPGCAAQMNMQLTHGS